MATHEFIVRGTICQRCGQADTSNHLCPDRTIAAHRRLMDERGGDLQGYLAKHKNQNMLSTAELYRADLSKLMRLSMAAKDFIAPETREALDRLAAINWR